MEEKKLDVLIVSKTGAHQKAIQTMCAAISQFNVIDTVTSTQQALEIVKNNKPDLLVLGANLAVDRACQLLGQVKELPSPPYCIALTHMTNDPCFGDHITPSQVISTWAFADRLLGIMTETFSQNVSK